MNNFRKIISVVLVSIVIFSSFAIAVSAEDCTHSYSTTNVAPTCVEAGYTLYVCSLCGDNYKEYKNGLPALNHNYGAWYTVDEATCSSEGHLQRDCSRCPASETKTLAVISHTDKNSDGKCDVCSATVEIVTVFSPFDWLVAFFNAVIQWFKDIFA